MKRSGVRSAPGQPLPRQQWAGQPLDCGSSGSQRSCGGGGANLRWYAGAAGGWSGSPGRGGGAWAWQRPARTWRRPGGPSGGGSRRRTWRRTRPCWGAPPLLHLPPLDSLPQASVLARPPPPLLLLLLHPGCQPPQPGPPATHCSPSASERSTGEVGGESR